MERLKASAFQLAENDPILLMQVIEREDPSWDIRLRHLELQQRKAIANWMDEAHGGKVIDVVEDPFGLPAPKIEDSSK